MSEPADPAGEPDDVGAASEAARRLFGQFLPLAATYAALLAGDGVAHGLIGPREAARLWDRHLVPGAVPATLIPRGSRVGDVGSGAGLPGLALALARPDLHLTLVEPMERRCVFLRRAVDLTGTGDRVRVRRARAEELVPEAPGFDAVTARAVARLPRLLDWLLPLSRPGGQILAIKGAGVPAEIDEARSVLDGPLVRRWDLVELAIPGATAAGPGPVPDVVRLVRVVTADNVFPLRSRPRSGRSRGARRPVGRGTERS